ncbi:MAG: hypothetical protein ACRDH6_05755 [Actinomycetota bacterium]
MRGERRGRAERREPDARPATPPGCTGSQRTLRLACYGGKGDDVLYDGEGTDYVVGGPGNDTLYKCRDDEQDTFGESIENIIGPSKAYCHHNYE